MGLKCRFVPGEEGVLKMVAELDDGKSEWKNSACVTTTVTRKEGKESTEDSKDPSASGRDSC